MRPRVDGQLISLDEKRWERDSQGALEALRVGQKIRVWPRGGSFEGGELARVIVDKNPDGHEVMMFQPLGSSEKVRLDPAKFEWVSAEVKKPE